MQAKTEWMEGELYNPARSFRNVESESRLERVCSEPFPGEVGARLGAAPEALDRGSGTCHFRLQSGDCLTDRLGRHSVLGQIELDPFVPIPTLGERLRTGAGEPLVVDVADALEGVERVGSPVFVDPRAREAILDLAP